MISKPCALRGCPVPVLARCSSELRRKKYCSQSHATKDRMLRGWKPVRPPLSSSIRGGRKGGYESGVARREMAVARAVDEVISIVPEDLMVAIPSGKRYLLTGLLAEAYRRGQRSSMKNLRRRLSGGGRETVQETIR